MTDMRSSLLAVERLTPQYWRVSFDHQPINTITADTVAELSRVVDESLPARSANALHAHRLAISAYARAATSRPSPRRATGGTGTPPSCTPARMGAPPSRP
jgi:hypothetical protein